VDFGSITPEVTLLASGSYARQIVFGSYSVSIGPTLSQFEAQITPGPGCNDFPGPDSCADLPAFPTYTTRLLFSVTAGEQLQLSWIDAVYSPPAPLAAVPEPSTWAMLLIGFAGIGFMTCRKRFALAAT
jgi:hypothetical protein